MKKRLSVIFIGICLTAAACGNGQGGAQADGGLQTETETQEGTKTQEGTETQSDEAGSASAGQEASAGQTAADAARENNAAAGDADEIGEDAAKAIALGDCGLTEEETSYIRVALDRDDGRTVYDVEFYADMMEYDYEIDASSGEIVSCEFDVKNGILSVQPEGAALSPEEAKAAALERAGVGADSAVFQESSYEYDDGVAVYKFEFVSGTTEYEVEINAGTGAVIEYEAESVYD